VPSRFFFPCFSVNEGLRAFVFFLGLNLFLKVKRLGDGFL